MNTKWFLVSTMVMLSACGGRSVQQHQNDDRQRIVLSMLVTDKSVLKNQCTYLASHQPADVVAHYRDMLGSADAAAFFANYATLTPIEVVETQRAYCERPT